ncbi:MAG: hypothetical protein V4537_16115 [Pseudomonadota bacterium]
MKHDHQFDTTIEGAAGGRCRLCSANDLDGVIEKLAADLWESRRHGTLDDWPWVDAGPQWQQTFREFAATAVASLTSPGLLDLSSGGA